MKKILIALFTLLIAAFPLVGCGAPELPDTETDIIIEIFDGGYGTNVFRKIADAFEEENEEYTVHIVANSQLLGQQTEAKLQAGPSVNPTDLFFSAELNYMNIVDRGDRYIKGYDCALEDLSDLLDEETDGVKIRNKMNASFVDHFDFNGKYYAFPWSSDPNGIAYRADYFEENGWTVPRTTQELAELLPKMRDAGYTPFVWPGRIGYWDYAVLPWWAQYVGDAGMEDFWNCIDEYGDMSAEAFRQYGRYEAFYALEMMIGDENNSHESSLSYIHTDAQMALYNDKEKIVMMPTGGWLEIEMQKSSYEPGEVNVGLMRPPVLSSILEYNGKPRFTTITTEAKLREVVSAIDEGTGCPADVDPEEFAEMTKIRSYVYNTGFEQVAIIPAYANAKEGAKEFLKFMSTNRAAQIYYDVTDSYLMYDNSKIVQKESQTTFQKDKADIIKNVSYVSIADSKNPIFYKTDLEFDSITAQIAIGAATGSPDKMSAEKLWEEEYNTVDRRWKTLLEMAGITVN